MFPAYTPTRNLTSNLLNLVSTFIDVRKGEAIEDVNINLEDEVNTSGKHFEDSGSVGNLGKVVGTNATYATPREGCIKPTTNFFLAVKVPFGTLVNVLQRIALI